jgi:predicted metal-binding membrane protein
VPDAAGFVYRRWGAHGPWRDALGVGAAYGRSCVGCCWALMLVAFAVGMASLGWMLILAAITTAEKAGLAGPWLVRGAGAALVAAGLAVAVG